MTRYEEFNEFLTELERTDMEMLKEIDSVTDLDSVKVLSKSHERMKQSMILLDIAKSLALIADAFYGEEFDDD